jgi:hypothetical protein
LLQIIISGGLTADILLLLTTEKLLKGQTVLIDDTIKSIIYHTAVASRIKVDVSDLGQMLSIIRSILGSKSLIKVKLCNVNIDR